MNYLVIDEVKTISSQESDKKRVPYGTIQNEHFSHIKKIILVVLLICSAFQLFADKWDNKTAELKGKKILVFTKNGEGFVHDNIEENVNMFLRLGEQYDFRVDSTSSSAIFATENLFQYDAVVFANTNNKVFESEMEKEGLVQFNRQGKGIVGIHIACGTEREWKWFKQMIGGTFDFHPRLQKFNVRVVDDKHPSAREIPPVWEVEDELYIMKEMNPTVRILMVSDFSSPDFQHSDPMPNTFGTQFPSVWCNEFDGGRQWFTALGHKKEDYGDPLFISHIVGGLQWVLAK